MSALATVIRSVTEWTGSELIDYVIGAVAFVVFWLVLVFVFSINDGTTFY